MDVSSRDVKFDPLCSCMEMRFPLADQFPDKVNVRSARTGRVVEFVKDRRLAEASEFWDGEIYVYTPTEGYNKCGVLRLTLVRDVDN